jgi:hemerythrin-like domain-containing protein
VTINPAFFQEIKDDNRHLRDLRIAVQALIENRRVLRSHRNRLVTLLDELRDQLGMHFTLEETFGYFDDAIDVAPHLSESADRLRQEHGELFATVVDITDNTVAAQGNGFPSQQTEKLVDRIHEFEQQLTKHEEEETRLIFEAMNRDIGGEG